MLRLTLCLGLLLQGFPLKAWAEQEKSCGSVEVPSVPGALLPSLKAVKASFTRAELDTYCMEVAGLYEKSQGKRPLRLRSDYEKKARELAKTWSGKFDEAIFKDPLERVLLQHHLRRSDMGRKDFQSGLVAAANQGGLEEYAAKTRAAALALAKGQILPVQQVVDLELSALLERKRIKGDQLVAYYCGNADLWPAASLAPAPSSESLEELVKIKESDVARMDSGGKRPLPVHGLAQASAGPEEELRQQCVNWWRTAEYRKPAAQSPKALEGGSVASPGTEPQQEKEKTFSSNLKKNLIGGAFGAVGLGIIGFIFGGPIGALAGGAIGFAAMAALTHLNNNPIN